MFTIYKFDLEHGEMHSYQTDNLNEVRKVVAGETNSETALFAVDKDNAIIDTNVSPEYDCEDYYEPDVDECGYDPYLGCYTDDC